jgi:hypothetical protein
MGSLIRRAIAVCTITATVAAVALAATASGRPSSRCEAAFLHAKMSVIHGSAAAGHIEYLLTIHNRGPSICLVHEHPGLELLGAGGQHLPTHVKDQGQGGLAVIHLGQTVSAKLRFSPDIPGPGEPGHGPCEQPAHHVKVTLNQSITLVAAVEPPTSVCQHGAIEERPLS